VRGEVDDQAGREVPDEISRASSVPLFVVSQIVGAALGPAARGGVKWSV
jgi:hypothetical protein